VTIVQDLKAAIPDPEVLLSFQPEELEGLLLPIMKRSRDRLSLGNFVGRLLAVDIYPTKSVHLIGRSIAEAVSVHGCGGESGVGGAAIGACG
jgi:hypothetical protein